MMITLRAGSYAHWSAPSPRWRLRRPGSSWRTIAAAAAWWSASLSRAR